MDQLLPALGRHLESYLAGDCTVGEFRAWFRVHALGWAVDEPGESALADLVYAVELSLSEFEDGVWTDRELVKELRQLWRRFQRPVEPAPSMSAHRSIRSMVGLRRRSTRQIGFAHRRKQHRPPTAPPGSH